MNIYAGLDIDGVVKLFDIENDQLRLIRHREWLKIINNLDLQAGEMPAVKLSKNPSSFVGDGPTLVFFEGVCTCGVAMSGMQHDQGCQLRQVPDVDFEDSILEVRVSVVPKFSH